MPHKARPGTPDLRTADAGAARDRALALAAGHGNVSSPVAIAPAALLRALRTGAVPDHPTRAWLHERRGF